MISECCPAVHGACRNCAKVLVPRATIGDFGLLLLGSGSLEGWWSSTFCPIKQWHLLSSVILGEETVQLRARTLSPTVAQFDILDGCTQTYTGRIMFDLFFWNRFLLTLCSKARNSEEKSVVSLADGGYAIYICNFSLISEVLISTCWFLLTWLLANSVTFYSINSIRQVLSLLSTSASVVNSFHLQTIWHQPLICYKTISVTWDPFVPQDCPTTKS